MTSQGMYITFPPQAKIDFQVEAMIGYTARVVEGDMAPWYFFGEKSGWSNTQTIAIESEATEMLSPATTPTQEPTRTEFTAIIGATILAIIVGAGLGLLVFKIRRKGVQ